MKKITKNHILVIGSAVPNIIFVHSAVKG